MAKRVEITRTSIMAELNKLNTQLEKAQKALAKKEAAAEKYGVKDMDKEEHIEGNSGWTMRSRHCFTLYLEGHGVVFTSGEFWRAYGVIKNN